MLEILTNGEVPKGGTTGRVSTAKANTGEKHEASAGKVLYK